MANSEEKKEIIIDEKFYEDFPKPTYEEWKEAAIKLLKGGSFEKKLMTKTHEGITLDPVYGQKDIEGLAHLGTYPGMAPYVRGNNATGYIERPWEVAQECSNAFPNEFNEVALDELAKGSTAVNVILDEATSLGKNADKVVAEQVGNRGISLSSLDDINRAFNEIDFSKTPIYMSAGASSLGMLSLVMALVKAQGKDYKDFKGLIGADPIGVLAQDGKLEKSLESLYDEMALAVKWARENAEDLKTISVEGHVYSNAGANAIQELAFVFATAVTYIKALLERGLKIDDIAQNIRFSLSIGSNYFMEISKLRAARMVWSQIVDAFGGNEDSQRMIINGRTAKFTKSFYDPYVNMLRTTTETFSAVIGGVDSFHVSPFDEPIRESDNFSRRIARNQQIILREECNLKEPIDPAGGSWYVEKLTHIIGEKVWELFQEVEEKGGITKALEEKFVQGSIDEVLEGRFKNLEVRKDVKAGINMYANMSEELEKVPFIDYKERQEKRVAEINEYLKDIDDEAKKDALNKLDAKSDAFLDLAIEAVCKGATLEEITSALACDGEFTIEALEEHRLTERFERLRKDTEDYVEKTGENIQVFLVNLGKIPQHKGRADFSTGFFEVGAFEILKNDGFLEIEDAAKACVESGAPVAVICSTDKTYPELVPPLAKMIKKERPDLKLFLAGNPSPELREIYEEAGVEDYVHVRANCYQILRDIQKERGVIE